MKKNAKDVTYVEKLAQLKQLKGHQDKSIILINQNVLNVELVLTLVHLKQLVKDKILKGIRK
jgi:hypothetical protein